MRRASKNAKYRKIFFKIPIRDLNFSVKTTYTFSFYRGRCEKKVYLFSDLGSPFGNDQLDTITEGLRSLDIQLTLM